MGNFKQELMNEEKIDNLYSNITTSSDFLTEKIDIIGARTSDSSSLVINIGDGEVFPVTGELLEKWSKTADFIGYYPYLLDKSWETFLKVYEGLTLKDSLKEDEVAMLNTLSLKTLQIRNFIERNKMSLGGTDLDSYLGVLYSQAIDFHSGISYENNMLKKQLSSFNLIKISREKAIVAFIENKLKLVVHTSRLRDDFNGMIEFGIFTRNGNEKKLLFKKKQLLLNAQEKEFLLIDIPEGLFIGEIFTENFESKIDYYSHPKNNSFVLRNKTPENMKVTLKKGSTVMLDPFGIIEVSSGGVANITTLLSTDVDITNISSSTSDGLLFKDEMKLEHYKGYFSHDFDEMIIDPTQANVLKAKSSCLKSKKIGFRYAKINGDWENASYVEFGDDADKEKGIRIDSTDFIYRENELWAKASSDLNFEQVVYTNKEATVNGVRIEKYCEQPFGELYKSQAMIYKRNWLIENGKVDEIIEKVFSVEITSIERRIAAVCECSDSGNPPLDTMNDSKNEYHPSEVSTCIASEKGFFVHDKLQGSNRYLNTWHRTALGKYCENGFKIKSFGVYDRFFNGIQEPHFLDELISKEERPYSSKKEKQNRHNIFMWTVIQQDDGLEILFVEHSDINRQDNKFVKLGYTESKNNCNDKYVYTTPKLQKYGNILGYTLLYAKNPLPIPNNLTKTTLLPSTTISNTSVGCLNLVGSATLNKIGNMQVTCASVQKLSFGTETHLIDNLEIVDFFSENKKYLVSADVGAIFDITGRDIELNEESTITEIKECYKRGISVVNGDIEIIAVFNTSDQKVTASYELKINGESIVSSSQKYPRIAEYPKDAYSLKNTFSKDCCIPEKLAQFLYKTYGHVQGIIGIWQEETSINDSLLHVTSQRQSFGFQVSATINGISPEICFWQVLETTRHFNTPYLMSKQMLIRSTKTGLISPSIFNDEKDNGIALALRKAIIGNYSYNFQPVNYNLQGIWTPAVDFVLKNEKILLSQKLKYSLFPGTRLGLDIKIGLTNTLFCSQEGNQGLPIYEKIDGVVTKDNIVKNMVSSFQKGSYAHHIKYNFHIANGRFVSREIIVDLERYPAKQAYLQNNAVRELLSPVREDALQKKLDGSSVLVKFDTRRIADLKHTYFDWFSEAPTALLCGEGNDESVLNRSDKLSLYKIAKDSFSPEECKEGAIFFENKSDTERELTISFKNNFIGYLKDDGICSYSFTDCEELFEANILFSDKYGKIKNSKQLGKTMGVQQ